MSSAEAVRRLGSALAALWGAVPHGLPLFFLVEMSVDRHHIFESPSAVLRLWRVLAGWWLCHYQAGSGFANRTGQDVG